MEQLSTISPELNAFISTNIELIESGNYTTLYKRLREFGLAERTSEFTCIMLSCQVNPLEYMVEIPRDFLFAPPLTVTHFNIPNNIVSIKERAFSTADLKTIDIPEGVTSIETRAFSGCRDLEIVYLPKSLTWMSTQIFTRCYALHTINYPGLYTQFEMINKYDTWLSGSQTLQVNLHCKDGVFKITK